jgi:hypothetical protein
VQVVGRVVHECLAVHGARLVDLDLYHTGLAGAFGRHRFALRERRDRNCVEVLVMVENALLVAQRLQELVEEAVASAIPGLMFALAVKRDGGTWSEHDDWDPGAGAELVILDGPAGLAATLEAPSSKDVPVGRGRRLPPLEAMQRFAGWLPPRGALSWYDAFVSYRWGGLDTELADALFAGLSYAVVGTRPVRAFLDRRRLESGRNFTTDFSTALAKSKVAAPQRPLFAPPPTCRAVPGP